MRNRKKNLLVQRRGKYGYLFAAPWIIGLVVFVIFPLIEAVRISFSKLSVGLQQYTLDFVGFENYRNIFLVDTEYRVTLLSSFSAILYQVPLVIFFSFFLASVLNMKFKSRGLVRSILFIPVVIASGTVDVLMKNDYLSTTAGSDAGTEQVEGIIHMISNFDMPLQIVTFLQRALQEVGTITTMSAVPIVIFIAALQAISDSIYEAAFIEGASAWEVFWKIRFPLVSPHILVCVIYCLIDSLNSAANPVVALIKQTTYTRIEYGSGSAMSVVYMLVTLLLVFLVYKVISRVVVYSD